MHIVGQALRGKRIRIPGLSDALECVFIIFQLGYNATLDRSLPTPSVTNKDKLDEY